MLEPSKNFTAYLTQLRLRLTQEHISNIEYLKALLPDGRKPQKYTDIGASFIAESKKLHRLYGDTIFAEMNKLLVGELALKISDTIKPLKLTNDILALYPAALRRIETSLMAEGDGGYYYPAEYFVKDLRFVAGFTVPCGAMVLDLRSLVSWKLWPLFIKNSCRNMLHFMRCNRKAPWFRSHLELRYLDEFNEQGMTRFYLRVADLLKTNPDVHGLVSASWFYDAALEKISPHLGYLCKMPLAHGAFIMRGSTSQFDIASATAKSRLRRQKYEDGTYKPVCCLLVWPRDALLRWRDNQERVLP